MTKRIALIVATFFVGFLASGWYFAGLHRASTPSDWQLVYNTLIIKDDHGRQVWRKTFDKDLNASRYERDPAPGITQLIFNDLDEDGSTETLFVQQNASRYGESNVLICFSQSGQEKWRFTPGRPIRTGTLTFEPIFNTRTFAVGSLGRNRPKVIVVVSNQYLRFPVQVALLSAEGKLLRDYWHSGMIGHPPALQIADLDDDGRNEIYLGGVNQARQQGTLVVLDPDQMEGASEELDPKYQLLDFRPGREVARVFFPRTCVNQKFERYGWVSQVSTRNGKLVVEQRESFPAEMRTTQWRLSPKLAIEHFGYSERFLSFHARLVAEKQLDHSLAPQEAAAMRTVEVLRND